MLLVSLMISFTNSLLKKVVQTSRNYENTFNSELLSHLKTLYLGLEPCEELHVSGLAQDGLSVSIGCCVDDLRQGKDSVCVNVNLDYSAAEAFI